jgi:hypothetical protein
MRYNRRNGKTNADRSLSFAFRSVSRQIKVEMSVSVVIQLKNSDPLLDDFYLNRPTMYVLGLYIEDFLIDKYPQARILAVKVARMDKKR